MRKMMINKRKKKMIKKMIKDNKNRQQPYKSKIPHHKINKNMKTIMNTCNKRANKLVRNQTINSKNERPNK